MRQLTKFEQSVGPHALEGQTNVKPILVIGYLGYVALKKTHIQARKKSIAVGENQLTNVDY